MPLRSRSDRLMLLATVCVTVPLASLDPPSAHAQQWTWISGSSHTNQYGIYGTLNVSATGNTPGARAAGASWVGASGDLWLFGGTGYGESGVRGRLNDCWKFSPATRQWTWVGGSSSVNSGGIYETPGTPSTSAYPAARSGPACWTDPDGSFWLFGNSTRNDLWKYSPATGLWTWVRGSASEGATGSYGTLGVAHPDNDPPPRNYSGRWSDSAGKIWLFGGENPNYLNDLWKFDRTTSLWTWVRGSNQPGGAEVRGPAGVEHPTYTPPALSTPMTWSDSEGHLWLFGGSRVNGGLADDLWRFNPATQNWAWMDGSTIHPRRPSYGTLGVASAGSHPGRRWSSGAWRDSQNRLWLFGGDLSNLTYRKNDLWSYSPDNGLWTWSGGSQLDNPPGVYGSLGISSSGSSPGGRFDPTLWQVSDGTIWVLGGQGMDSSGAYGRLNDLWRLQLTPAAAREWRFYD